MPTLQDKIKKEQIRNWRKARLWESRGDSSMARYFYGMADGLQQAEKLVEEKIEPSLDISPTQSTSRITPINISSDPDDPGEPGVSTITIRGDSFNKEQVQKLMAVINEDMPKVAKDSRPSINWSHVAPQYKWLARDKSGTPWLYTQEPEIYGVMWTTQLSAYTPKANGFTSYHAGTCDWQDSLVKRPEEEKDSE